MIGQAAAQRTNPYRPGTPEAIRFDYMKTLTRLGLDYGLGRQMDDVRVGNDMYAIAFNGDGRGRQRQLAYQRYTNNALLL